MLFRETRHCQKYALISKEKKNPRDGKNIYVRNVSISSNHFASPPQKMCNISV